jgi:transglutaminase-like putative cysteine protease
MTATVAPALPAGSHWRAASYDTYTGRGWTLSQEREETFPAGTRLPLPAAQEQTVFTQTVHWLYDDRAIRYTVGLPLQFGGESTVYWRGVADFSRAQGSGTSYSAPAVLLSRYTKLPGGLPQRVVQLAHDVAGSLPTPYDQARALEAFLRQYPYSLEVESPPPGRDPVEFFLFELQEGYCDYYASAMVVMARSLGLPARLATGYLAQPPDARGVQTMFQINAHAWAEVYFAGYGWVEFEPTAAFPTAAGADAAVTESDPGLSATEPAVEPPPIPEGAPSRLSSLWAVLLMLLIAGLWLWWHRRPAAARGVAWAYERLLRAARALGQPTPPSETPLEFAAAFVARLAGWEQHSRLGRLLHDVRPGVERLTILFVAQQYGGAPAGWSARSEARRIWRHLAGRLRLLRLWLFLKKGLK